MRLFALLLVSAAFFGCNKDKDASADGTETGPDEVADPYEGHDMGAWLSMKPTPDGKPALAYYDRTSDALGFAIGTVSGSSVTWARESVDSYPDENGLNPGDAGKYASMAIASDGTVWIAYQDTTNGSLKYATKPSGGTWTIGIADAGAAPRYDAGYWASIALDASGNPVIAHYDGGDMDLRVARWNGTAFVADTVVEGTDYVPADTATPSADGQVGEYAKLLISGSTEYIAFYDRAYGALKLASGSGGAYSVETVDDTADVGQWPDLAMDGSNLVITYHDVTNQDLKMAVGTPGSFTVQTLDSGNLVGADSAVAVAGGATSIVYFDGHANNINVARPSSGSFTYASLAGDDAALGYHNEIVSLGGTLYAACYDYTNRAVWFGSL